MLEHIISRFSLPGLLTSVDRFGSGLINDTYLCACSDKGALRKYILQHINKTVFKHPELVMRNIELVTGHVQNRLRSEGVSEPESVTPALIQTKNGSSFYLDASSEYWRMFHFIETCEVFDTVTGAEHAYEIGRGLGRFQALVSDLRPELLHDTLPGFHHTPVYLKEFDDALASGTGNRVAAARGEIAFVNTRRPLARALTDHMASGRIPVRVVHNDPKISNFLIHRETKKMVCMVDLDTVKPGLVHFDFGDCVRSVANPAGEDAADPGSVRIDLSLFEAITRGYLAEARSFLIREEVALLPIAVNVITFELGLRFLADYLRNDVYFKTTYAEHNLHRARVQFRLLESIEAVGDRMAALVEEQYATGKKSSAALRNDAK